MGVLDEWIKCGQMDGDVGDDGGDGGGVGDGMQGLLGNQAFVYCMVKYGMGKVR